MTQDDYAVAIRKLVDLAQQGTGGGRIAAQVLLSAYNGYDFQLDVSELGGLDRKNFEAAMMVIRGRYELAREPHDLITNGSEVFGALWKRWGRLHVKERAKVDCRECRGYGRKYTSESDEDGTLCPCCEGKGTVCECKAY